MEEQRWDRVARLFEEAQHLEATDRADFLQAACGSDEALLQELVSMLRVDGDSGFLATPLPELHPSGDQLVGSEFGGFKLLGRLGEGGMGAVYEAQQSSPSRRVALKVMRSALASKSARKRFEVEADLLGRLHHPNIAQVFEAGVHKLEGGFELPYFAMEFVKDARHLTRFADDENLDVKQRLALMLEVCDAISAAHRRGILHRDLKPSNLLVDADGRVRVIDFGVARAMEDELMMTRTGEIVGTPVYMSPEQLAGRPAGVDAQSDVWALGVVLYRLITSALPFEFSEGSLGLLSASMEQPPMRASLRNPLAPVDLDWVVERALEHDRTRRYGSVGELGDELRRLLANEPVFAVPASRVYRIKKFTRRNRVLVGAIGAIALALVVGTVLATAGFLKARTAEAAARDEARIARNEAAKFAGINRVLRTMFTSFDATQVGADARVVDMLDTSAVLLPAELADQPRVRKALHLVLASSYGSIGEVERSLEHAQQVLALGEGQPDNTGIEEVEAACLGAEAATRMGQVSRAREFLEIGAAYASEVGFTSADLGLRLRLGKARLLAREGELDSALEILRRLSTEVGEREDLLPQTSYSVRHALAATLRSAQNFEGCQRAYETLLRDMESQGDTGFSYELARLGLAGAQLRTGQAQPAQKLLVEILPALSGLTGAGSVHTIKATKNLAAAYVQLQQFEEARTVLENVLEAVDPDDQVALRQSLSARQQLAVIRGQLGETKASLDDLRRVLSMTIELYGEETSYTATARLSLAKQLIRASQFAEAEPELRESLRVKEAIGDGVRLGTYQCRAALGETLTLLGRPAEAVDFLREAWDGFAELVGPGAEETVTAGTNAIATMSRLGDWKRAIPLAERLYEGTLEQLGPGHPGVMAQAVNLGAMYGQVGRVADSEVLLINAIAGARRTTATPPPEFADMLLLRGRQLRDRKLLDEALAAFEESYALRRDDKTANPIIGATLRAELGKTLALLERDEEAFDHLTAAHRTLARMIPAESPFMQSLVRDVASVLDRLGRTAEAADWRARLPEQK